MAKQKKQRTEETAVEHMKQLLANKQVRSSEHNKGRKMQEVHSIIQNTGFAMAFSTVYSAYMWLVNTCMALTHWHTSFLNMAHP